MSQFNMLYCYDLYCQELTINIILFMLWQYCTDILNGDILWYTMVILNEKDRCLCLSLMLLSTYVTQTCLCVHTCV